MTSEFLHLQLSDLENFLRHQIFDTIFPTGKLFSGTKFFVLLSRFGKFFQTPDFLYRVIHLKCPIPQNLTNKNL